MAMAADRRDARESGTDLERDAGMIRPRVVLYDLDHQVAKSDKITPACASAATLPCVSWRWSGALHSVIWFEESGFPMRCSATNCKR
jgi:hypothetical protein